jgi:sulfonate transport system substrate-binding protein
LSRSPFIATVALLGAVVLTASACGSSSSNATSSATVAAATRGSSASSKSSGYKAVPAGTVLNVGDQDQSIETLFKESGVEAQLPSSLKLNFVEFDSGPLVDAGFAAHRIDVGSMGDLPAALAISSKLPVKAVNIELPVGKPDEFLIAKPGIDSTADLRGKTVAYTTGTAEQAFALRALDQAGLTQADVHQANVTLQQLYTVLEAGSVDASVVNGVELKDTYLASHPGAKVLATDLSLKPPSYGYLLATDAALANKAKVAAIYDFTKAALIAANWAYTHEQQYANEYLVDVEHETPAQAKEGANALVDSQIDVADSSSVAQSLQEVVKVEVEAKAIPKSFNVASLYSDTSWWPQYNAILKEVHQDA